MKISDLPVLNDAKGNAYIPVVDPDETNPALRNKRIYLSTIAASIENFEPFDPAKEYSRAAPDFVSYSGNVYEYIYPTPATGILPTNTSYWKIVSAGQFNHIQNTDLGTRHNTFTRQLNSQNQDIEGFTGDIYETQQGGKKIAKGFFWFNDGAGNESYEEKICYNYTGTGSDVWEDIGAAGGSFKGAYVNGEKVTGEFWATSKGIWKVLQDFESLSAPTTDNAYWQLILPVPNTVVQSYTAKGLMSNYDVRAVLDGLIPPGTDTTELTWINEPVFGAVFVPEDLENEEVAGWSITVQPGVSLEHDGITYTDSGVVQYLWADLPAPGQYFDFHIYSDHLGGGTGDKVRFFGGDGDSDRVSSTGSSNYNYPDRILAGRARVYNDRVEFLGGAQVKRIRDAAGNIHEPDQMGTLPLPNPKRPTKTITGSYTVTAADHWHTIIYDSTSPGTITIPDLGAGFDFVFLQANTGKPTFAGSTNSVVINLDDLYTMRGEGAVASGFTRYNEETGKTEFYINGQLEA